ncbi:MAG: sulfide dehydrogenase (flavocytochrome), flavoprotein subunit [Betaproteobacteria bacterium]|nr:sulfide dehydrogenase (flavocytochrome), flavoprotein subunit [Betaproteobacteria bacterium]
MIRERRRFIRNLAAIGAGAALTSLHGIARAQTAGRVVVIGGGYSGATCARYIRRWSPDIEVTLIERSAEFISCPLSNLVLGGTRTLSALTLTYDGLRKHGVKVVVGEAAAIDAAARTVRLRSGDTLAYDRLVVAPGVDTIYDTIPGLKGSDAQGRVLHAWKAGEQTLALRKQLEAMRDGGVFAIHVPRAPYRCAPAPYERACQVAWYFKNAKPKSKVIVLDANEDVQSKKALFMAAWNGPYKGIVDYRPNSELTDVDAQTLTAKLEFEDVKADVLNIVPPQRAGAIAASTGLITANGRWCGVDWLTMESTSQKGIHVLGDAVLAAPVMPKSGHMANQHGKVCAAAVIALIKNQPVNQQPLMINTCYSLIDDKNAGHVATVHAYDAAEKTMIVVKGSGGLSDKANELEGGYANSWAKTIWADMLG